MNARFKGSSSSLGFISAGGPSSFGYLSKESTSYRTILGEDDLELIQFAMQFGEVLTIKYGKISNGVDINAPYSFEPYQLKEIEGRWYVIGNLYPLGHKESAEIAVYDLARLQFADEENPDVLYEPIKGFNFNSEETRNYICERTNRPFEGWFFERVGTVVTILIWAHSEEFAKYLSENPLCSSQDIQDIEEGESCSMRIRLSPDLLIMFGAYGDELSFEVQSFYDRVDPECSSGNLIVQEQLSYFRKTGE